MSKPYSQPGEKGTDTNQASEELDDILQNLSWAQHELGTKGLIPLSKHEYEAKAKIESIIRTEKLKLLAEVRERRSITFLAPTHGVSIDEIAKLEAEL